MGINVDVVYAGLSAEPISVDAAIAAVESETAGAVVTFSGVVRNHDGGRQVARLSYSSHPLAKDVLDGILSSLVEGMRDPSGHPLRIWVAHRVGALAIGEPALVCAVASSHRRESFELCAELVERIKAEVPIWKEQFFTDGTAEWVGAGHVPEVALEQGPAENQ